MYYDSKKKELVGDMDFMTPEEDAEFGKLVHDQPLQEVLDVIARRNRRYGLN